MKYVWDLQNPDIFEIFMSFLIVYGVIYRIIIPIVMKNRRLWGFTPNQNVHLIRYSSSFLFFFIIFYAIKVVIKSEPSRFGIRLSFPLVGLILYVTVFPILLKYSIYQSRKLPNDTRIKSLDLNIIEIIKILISWIFYITGYEMLYRGVFLYSLIPVIGKWEAITVVTSIYFFDHVSKDYYVTLGAFFIGVIAKFLLESGFKESYGDSPSFYSMETAEKNSELKEIADRIGIRTAYFTIYNKIFVKEAKQNKYFTVTNAFFEFDYSNCIKCHVCYEICLTESKSIFINDENYPVYIYKTCIKCYCYLENCTAGAIYLR